MNVIRPQTIPVTGLDGEVRNIPDVTIMAWQKAIGLEIKTGLSMSRRSASAIAKQHLGLPKNLSKKKTLMVVDDLVNQMKQARRISE